MPLSPLKTLIILGSCLIVLLGRLALERFGVSRRRTRIPLRVCVAGSRGKSTVTRLIAAALREAGTRVVAKTTGSKPVLIAPDGSEREIVRRGQPSILEQKKLLGAAARWKAGALVVEMMSIRAECLRVEARRIFKPRVLVVTNVRLDHLDDMGATKPEIAASLAAAVPEGGTVIIPEEEVYPAFEEAVVKRRARLIRVPRETSADSTAGRDFEEDARLTLAVAAFLGIDAAAARAGMTEARPDFGSLKIWKIPRPASGGGRFLVSAFAANDPESTGKAMDVLRRRIPPDPRKMIAVLNFRSDRGDRTEQWLRALGDGFFDSFDRVVFVGDQVGAAIRRTARIEAARGKVSAISHRSPEEITAQLLDLAGDEGIVFGAGNIRGLGSGLVEHWSAIGVPA